MLLNEGICFIQTLDRPAMSFYNGITNRVLIILSGKPSSKPERPDVSRYRELDLQVYIIAADWCILARTAVTRHDPNIAAIAYHLVIPTVYANSLRLLAPVGDEFASVAHLRIPSLVS